MECPLRSKQGTAPTSCPLPLLCSFAVSPPSPGRTGAEPLAPLSASSRRQEDRAPGRCRARRLSAAPGAQQPRGSARCSPARASPPRGAPAGAPAQHSREELWHQVCYRRPASHPGKNRTPVRPQQVRKSQGNSGAPSPQPARLGAHPGLFNPTPLPAHHPQGHFPAGDCVGAVPFSSRGGLRKGSNSSSSSSAACSHLSGSVSGVGS